MVFIRNFFGLIKTILVVTKIELFGVNDTKRKQINKLVC